MLNLDQSRTIAPSVSTRSDINVPQLSTSTAGSASNATQAALVVPQLPGTKTPSATVEIPPATQAATQQAQTGFAGVLPNANFKITTSYGSPSASSNPALRGRQHLAIDVATPMGTPIISPGYGKVIQNEPKNGTYIIRYDNGNSLVLVHTKDRYFNIGDTVRPGDVIGTTGNTGDSTGPHLHLGIIDSKGNRLNPTPFYRGTENPFGRGADNLTTGWDSNYASVKPSLDKEYSVEPDWRWKIGPVYEASDPWGEWFKYSNVATNSIGQPMDPLVNLSTGLGAGLNAIGTLPAFGLNWLTTGNTEGNAATRINTDWNRFLNTFGLYPSSSSTTSDTTTSGSDSTNTATDTGTNAAQASTSTSLTRDEIQAMKEAQARAMAGGATSQSLFQNIVGNVRTGTPAGANFNPATNPLDKALVDMGIVAIDQGANIDRDVLDALRLQVSAAQQQISNIEDQTAQQSVAQLNQANQSALAFLGSNPGDVSQSTAGRLALNSFGRKAQENIAANEAQGVQAKNAVTQQLASNATNVIQARNQQKFQLALSNASNEFSAAINDRDTNRAADALLAIARLEAENEIQQLNYNEEQATVAKISYFSSAVQSIRTQISEITAYRNAISATQPAEDDAARASWDEYDQQIKDLEALLKTMNDQYNEYLKIKSGTGL